MLRICGISERFEKLRLSNLKLKKELESRKKLSLAKRMR